MRRLDHATFGRLENGRQQLHLKHDVGHAIDVNTVSDVVSVLDEQEDNGGEYFLSGCTN